MARRNPVRDSLLGEVKKRQRAAGQKVSRLERQGIRVRKAELDPRRDMSVVEGMNSRQLRSYLGKLNAFTDRGNSFVAGKQGAPLSGQLFRQYKQRESAFNRIADKYFDTIKDVKVPGTGMTVAQRLATLNQTVQAGGDFKTFDRLNRRSEGIADDSKLKKLIGSVEKKFAPDYFQKEMKQMRNILEKMLPQGGNQDLLPAIRGMSDEQLNLLTDYTDFMSKASFRYDTAQSINENQPRFVSQVFEDSGDRVESLIDWAQNVNPGTFTNGTRTNKPRSRRLNFTPGTGQFNPIVDGAAGLAPNTGGKNTPKGFTPGKGKFNPKL